MENVCQIKGRKGSKVLISNRNISIQQIPHPDDKSFDISILIKFPKDVTTITLNSKSEQIKSLLQIFIKEILSDLNH